MGDLRIGIVGAGTMGGEIAFIATQAGFPVIMKDIEQRFLDAGINKTKQIYEFKVKRRRMSPEEMDEKIRLISTTLNYDGFADADFVIEAVPENLELKQKVFAELEKACPDRAILATNTSALSITKIAEKTTCRDRVVGMHFFNPVSMMRLVEVIRGAETSDSTVDATCALAEAMGKSPVKCADSAGFIVNRLLCAAMLEAIRCESEGLLPRAEIDNALVKPDAGLPIGLFKMADQLGIDLLYKVMKILEDAFGERLAVPEIIKNLHDQGALGVKSGKGFYEYGKP
ncbi:MAG TPA: 3-hydroxyacyl-CoA dehydrogenase family protein [bacterium]|nr:3-hydroxyacyl-CoA dehydrogenase family protein [bacterium]